LKVKTNRKLLKDKRPFMRLAGIMKGLPRDLSQRKGYSLTFECEACDRDRSSKAARSGGKMVGNARRELEKKSGRKVVTNENYLTLAQSAKKAKRMK